MTTWPLGSLVDVEGVAMTVWSEGPDRGTYWAFTRVGTEKPTYYVIKRKPSPQGAKTAWTKA